jgi:hypothetical protein
MVVSSPSMQRWRRRPCLYVYLFVAATAAVVVASNKSDPLVHWLDQLTIDIPDQSYKKGLIHLRIWELSCTHFTIERLYSSVGDPNVAAAITIQTSGVGAFCRGRYDASGMTGDVTVQLGGGAAGGKHYHPTGSSSSTADQAPIPDFLWTFSLFNDNDDDENIYPDHIATTDCETHVGVTDLHFDGSWSAKLIDLFRTDISNEINREISSATICPQWVSTVDPVVTAYIRRAVDDYIKPYVADNDDDDTENATSATRIQRTSFGTTTASRRRRQDEEESFRPSKLVASRGNSGRNDGADSSTSSTTNDEIVFSRDLPVLTNLLMAVNALVNDHLHHGLFFDTDCDVGLDGGVNGILRRLVPEISFPLPLAFEFHPGHNNNARVMVQLQNWTIAGAGLHEWQTLQVLLPPTAADDDESSSFVSRLQTSNLDVSVDATITVLTTPTAEPLLESFTMVLTLADLDVAANVVLQLDRPSFVQNVTAGDVLDGMIGLLSSSRTSDSEDGDSAMACLVNPVMDLHMAHLTPRVNISSLALRSAASDDQLEQDLDAVINDIVSGLILQHYPSLISKTIMGYARGPVQAAVNTFLHDQIDRIKHSGHNCTHSSPPSPPSKPHSWLDFTTIESLQQFNTFLYHPTTLSQINTYLDCAASKIAQIIQDHVAEYLSSSSEPLVVVDGLLFDHFGSLELLNVLRPINASTLQTSFSIGGHQGYFPHVVVNASVPAVNGEISMTLALTNFTWGSTAQILFDQGVLRRSSMQELLSQGHCILAPIYSLELVDFAGSLGRLELNATITVDVHNKSYAINFLSTDFPEIQDYIWTIFDWSIASLRKAVSAIAAATVDSAQQSCVPSSMEQKSTSDANKNSNSNNNSGGEAGGDSKLTAHALWVILGTLFILAQPLILLFRRETNARTAPDESSPERQLFEPLLGRHEASRRQDEVVVRRVSSLSLMHRFESHTVHYALPVMVIFTIVLFLVSNSSTGATVDLSVSISSLQHIALPGVYSFGLIDTAKNMLSAGIYPLFLLVVVFSGIWPYAKLLLMFSAWVAPPDVLSVKRREKLLTTLDACSKYSLVDTYVFIGRCQAVVCHRKSHQLFALLFSNAGRIPISFAVGRCRERFVV